MAPKNILPKNILTKAEGQMLKDRLNLKVTPGTILKDANTLLSKISTGKLPGTKKGAIGIRALPELNAALSHPLSIDLQRPQLKSFPNLKGLFLLLRGAGLVGVLPKGSKFYLTTDEVMVDAWRALNPVEQYLTLVDTWLFQSDPEQIGERGFRIGSQSGTLLNFYGQLARTGVDARTEPRRAKNFCYIPGFHSILLCELFGWLQVNHATPSGGGWNFQRLDATEFGRVMIKLIGHSGEHDIVWSIMRNPDSGRETTRKLFAKCFPDFRKTLQRS